MFDGGPGGARGAPPAIDQVTAEVKASGATLSSTRTLTRWSQRCRFRRLELHDPSGRRWLYRGSSTGFPSKWRRRAPVLYMSQRTKSHPGASCAVGSTNQPTEGSRIRGPANAQPRGFITSTMRPMMSPGRDSQIRSTRSIARAPESTSSQPRGFIISVPGVHDCRISPSTPCPSSPSARTNSRSSDLRPTPVGTVDRVAKGSALVFVLIDGDIRPGHSANESQTSPAPASGRGLTVASSRRRRAEREQRTASPEVSRLNAPSLGLHSFIGPWKSGSKMVEQVTCSKRRCRWPLPGPVPEVPSGALRWAS